MKTKRIELNISTHLLSAFINGDESGLDDSDKSAIDELINSYNTFHVYCPDENAQVDFYRCDVTGFFSDVVACLVEVS
jgi:hypothetical protein